MATPIVLNWSDSRNGKFHMIIRGARSGIILPNNEYKYYGKDGNTKTICVTGDMICRGRELYWFGIINISGAATYLQVEEKDPDAFEKFIIEALNAGWQPHLSSKRNIVEE